MRKGRRGDKFMGNKAVIGKGRRVIGRSMIQKGKWPMDLRKKESSVGEREKKRRGRQKGTGSQIGDGQEIGKRKKVGDSTPNRRKGRNRLEGEGRGTRRQIGEREEIG
jgi:hypothetical protein